MANRPFAVGDMVIVYGQPSIITKVGINMIYSKTGNFYFDEITAIRTPRKGGQEARDIVASLKWRARNFKRKISDNVNYRVMYEIVIGDCEIAKSMLK